MQSAAASSKKRGIPKRRRSKTRSPDVSQPPSGATSVARSTASTQHRGHAGILNAQKDPFSMTVARAEGAGMRPVYSELEPPALLPPPLAPLAGLDAPLAEGATSGIGSRMEFARHPSALACFEPACEIAIADVDETSSSGRAGSEASGVRVGKGASKGAGEASGSHCRCCGIRCGCDWTFRLRAMVKSFCAATFWCCGTGSG